MQLLELLLCLVVLTHVLDMSVSAQKRKCPKVSIKNGRVKIRARGKMAYFKCRKRYTRLGDKFAVCLQSGTWSHPPPQCISTGCPSLGVLPNMQITESYNGAMLKFVCPVGTKRRGPGTITCDGRNWSDTTPSCESGLTLSCNFEEEGLCGWSQDESDNFDWTRKSGKTPTMSTGPPGDHTTGSGHYMFIESSSPRKVGDVARLISPAYPPTLRNQCFSFWYHMQGADDENAVGSLEVYIKPETATLDDIDPEFYMDGNQGPDWQAGYVRIPDQDENFQIFIVGTRKDDFVSDIAIDDWRMYNCSEESTTAIPVTYTEQLTTDIPDATTADAQNTVNSTDGRLVSTQATSQEMTTTTTTGIPSTGAAYSTSTPPSSTLKSTQVVGHNATVQSSSSPTSASTPIPPTTIQYGTTTTRTVSTRSPTRKPRTWTSTPSSVVTSSSSVVSVRTRSPTRKPKTRQPQITKTTWKFVPSTTSSSAFTSSSSGDRTTAAKRNKQTSVMQQSTYTTLVPSKAMTNVYNYSQLVTQVMEVSTSQNPKSPQTSTLAMRSKTITTSDKSSVKPPKVTGSSGVTDSTSTVNSVGDTKNTRQSKSGKGASLLPLIIGISAGIVVGMLVIGLLAGLWARRQRKKKEREAAEDEMYMLSTGEGAFNFK